MLAKKYIFKEHKATGGTSKISLVTDKITKRLYACKTLNTMRYEYNAVNEIIAINTLMGSHNIVQLHDVIIEPNDIHLILSPCHGTMLRNMITKPIEERTVKKIMKKCIEIVKTCHERDVIHNDIKPENFLFENKNDDLDSLTLVDFGNALLKGQNKQFTISGTPHYMSKESLYMNTTKKSDVWSLGVMVYFMLSNKLPFNDKTNPHSPGIYQVWHSILMDEPKIKDDHMFTIEAQEFLLWVLQKDVESRPSIDEVLDHKWWRT